MDELSKLKGEIRELIKTTLETMRCARNGFFSLPLSLKCTTLLTHPAPHATLKISCTLGTLRFYCHLQRQAGP